MPKSRVLVVEDDPNGQKITRELLEYVDLDVDVVEDAEQALNWLDDRDYAAAIIDLSLPGMTSWELLQHIQQAPKTAELPCFAVTAYHTPQIEQETIAAGFVAYFPKPLNFDTFFEEIRARLAS